ncbi:MAG: hypothetical protein QOJ25_74 [Solirubrobacteraceae bacterium]|jgi:hypothetical protein|nr:hypothetical protein [Solirubrobacteraceae bacterium]
MPEMLEQLVDSLLFEGYALYPYTPGATKNATPTPFGIVYPPTYAATLTSTFDALELRCVLDAPADAALAAEVRFLAAGGDRHQAVEHRIDLAGKMVGALDGAPIELEERIPGAGDIELVVGVSLTTRPLRDRTFEVSVRVENRTEAPEGLDRGAALRYSLLSTHPIARVSGGRFISPLERLCNSINTYPVLATASDDAVIGATIVLPDHPQIAPESRGGLFDSTEIEEALLLHVHVLTDEERADIEAQGDPTLTEMINRASAATSEDIMALHGRVTISDPAPEVYRDPQTDEPPPEPPGLEDPRAGQDEVVSDGVTYRRGGKVVIRPAPEADLHARMLDGRTATIERIFTDYDGKMHLGVTVDDDPGQELMRETGRYLFFFAPEVEVMDT